METKKYDEVRKFAEKWADGMVGEYVNWVFEGWSECDGMEEITFDNLEEFKKHAWKNINYINDCDGCNPSEGMWDAIHDEFDWEDGEFDKFIDEHGLYGFVDWGTYAHIDYDCYGFYGIQQKVWEKVVEIAEEVAHENEIAKGKKFSKDDVMKFLKEAVEEFDEEWDDKKQMWYRKDFKGKYAKCDIAFVSSCDVRMEKIGKIEIDEDGDILIDFVSADKMDDVNVDIDVVEMMDKIAA